MIEYGAAFVVGLFVFQALFMLPMYGGNYLLAVRKTFFAETVSMNTVMIGMIPTMVILMERLPGSDNPTRALFWGVMSLATLAGMVTAYPINAWMVRRGLKHGMMSAPSPGGHAMGHGDPHGMGHEPMTHGHHAATLPWGQVIGILVLSFAGLAVVVWVTSLLEGTNKFANILHLDSQSLSKGSLVAFNKARRELT